MSTNPAEHLSKVIDLGLSVGRAERLTESFPDRFGQIEVRGVFTSEYAAKFAREAYLERWPHQGYGTFLTTECVEGQYIVSGFRADSCE